MISRRGFLGLVGSVPFLGFLKGGESAEAKSSPPREVVGSANRVGLLRSELGDEPKFSALGKNDKIFAIWTGPDGSSRLVELSAKGGAS